VKRVRDNQRRHRVRQKELIADLQNRLDEYERLGAHATLEMQRAARHVARENESLRALLSQKGVSATEVEEFLRVCDSGSAADQPVQERPSAAASTHHVSSIAALLNEEEPTTPGYSPHLWPPLSESQARPREEVARPAELPAMLDRNYTPPSSTHSLGSSEATLSRPADLDACCTSGMEMSCDVAATILANMQGHADTGRARAVLGCNGPSPCVIKSAKVFDLLDEAA
jgi:hypothetical protein